MDSHTIYSSAMPTPFGPVMTAHEHHELNAILRFQTELLALHRAVTPARSTVDKLASVQSAEEELVPALVRAPRTR